MDKISKAINELHDESLQTDFLLISRGIDRSLYNDLTSKITEKKNKKCHLFLTTYGGDPHAAYRIARCLRHNYDFLKIIIPGFCKSAGTLICVAADELSIGDCGELGPLDIQVNKPNEFMERSSGLDLMQAMTAGLNNSKDIFNDYFFHLRTNLQFATKLSAELSMQIATGALSEIYSQIDPLRLGELQRAMTITKEYGLRLINYTKNLKDESSLQRLVNFYPAHEFVIDRKEAKEFFKRVNHLTNAEKSFCATIGDIPIRQCNHGPMYLEVENTEKTQVTNRGEGESNGQDSKQTESSSGSEKDTSQPKQPRKSNGARKGATQ